MRFLLGVLLLVGFFLPLAGGAATAGAGEVPPEGNLGASLLMDPLWSFGAKPKGQTK